MGSTSSVFENCVALRDLAPCQDPGAELFFGALGGVRSDRLEEMMQELFRLQDLNCNGTLEEAELLKLNEKIAILHGGSDAECSSVRRRYSQIFRSELNAEGPVTFTRFRRYMYRTLDALDPDEPTQAMILDQFIAEADLALATFPGSLKVNPGFMKAGAHP
ncbi:unnamed protein product [Effrenium voratum]|uniref:EF-hand domain-containing protein n=1 Tax=Effrenium voratum TaxID=2562239 RepID=A0AA36JH10_9DINO|nr:unnamed protein product [Effrenium voratum]CAJ1413541.1 unnamed protein product [Effrenium voratum]CAJ1423590.1 unnamed protein product [Effrenium voratum]